MAEVSAPDGSLDLPAHLLEQYDISVVQPIIIIDGKELINKQDISPLEFFSLQRSAKDLPQTSQPSPQQFIDAFEEGLSRHERILYTLLLRKKSGFLLFSAKSRGFYSPKLAKSIFEW